MISAIALSKLDFTFDNTNRSACLVNIDPIRDFISVNLSEDIQNNVAFYFFPDITGATQQYAADIGHLRNRKQNYIQERNKILDNPFKYYNPFYKRKLREIDNKLDMIDLELYDLEKSNMPNEKELIEIIHLAQETLKKYSDFLPKN